MTDLARIESEQRDARYVVSVHGEIDISNAEDVLAMIETGMPNSAEELVVDLTDASYLDSAGVALLLRLGSRLRSRRQELKLVAPLDSPVREVCESPSCFVPSALPIAKATRTNASHPRMAVLRCWALQRPARAAMFRLVFKAPPGVVDCMGAACARADPLPVRLPGVLGCGYPHHTHGLATRDRASCRRV